MANNFTVCETCPEYHVVDAKLFATKEALRDALECGVTVKCVRCNLTAEQIPTSKQAVFARPPAWFLIVFKNFSNQLVTLEKARKK